MARSPKLNKELIDDIFKYMQNGMTDQDTCALCNIDDSTYYYWLQDARKLVSDEVELEDMTELERLKVELLETVKKGKASFKAYHVNNIMTAAKKSAQYWTASAWLLERKFPDEFGRSDRHNVSVEDNGMLDDMQKLLKEIKEGDTPTQTE